MLPVQWRGLFWWDKKGNIAFPVTKKIELTLFFVVEDSCFRMISYCYKLSTIILMYVSNQSRYVFEFKIHKIHFYYWIMFTEVFFNQVRPQLLIRENYGFVYQKKLLLYGWNFRCGKKLFWKHQITFTRESRLAI